MKVKIFYHKDGRFLRIPAVLEWPHKRIVSNFVLDTGSPHTILNYSDSIRLGIPHTEKSELIRMGGRTYQSYVFAKLTIHFKSVENQEIMETIPVRVLKPNSTKMHEIENLDNFPNLLGLDFLEKNYKLFCDIQSNEIFLEK